MGTIKPETKLCPCTKCGKTLHIEEAIYCTQCGTKLEQIPIQ